MMVWLRICLMLCVVYSGGAVLAASLSGVVRDEDNPVGRAEVILVNAVNKVVLRSVYSDAQGQFAFDVGPGVYNLRVIKADYALAIVKGVEIKQLPSEVAVDMRPGAFAEDEVVFTESECD